MEPAATYAAAVSEQLSPYAHQWSCLLTCSQERLVYRKALEYLPASARCLDWGCGNGHFSYFLRRKGFEVDALALDDPAPLIQRTGIRFTRGRNPMHIPFGNEAFDAAFGVGVLEHVSERGGKEETSLAELARVLKPGGLLFVFHLPNSTSWLEWAKGLAGQQQHENRYSRDEFDGLLRGLPMSVVEHGRYHLLPRASFSRLPRWMKDSPAWCDAVDSADDFLSAVLRPLCQNWYFILRKSYSAAR